MLIFIFKGRTYVLLFKSVKPEDAAEIKFVAEKASSVAKLTVRGWCFNANMVSVDCCMHFDNINNFFRVVTQDLVGLNNLF